MRRVSLDSEDRIKFIKIDQLRLMNLHIHEPASFPTRCTKPTTSAAAAPFGGSVV
jgi:hypothetical protein